MTTDLATDFLYRHPPLGGMPDVSLRIGVAFEVGGAHENWGFVVERRELAGDGAYRLRTIATGRTLEDALTKAREKLHDEHAASDAEKCACGNAMAMYRVVADERIPTCMECFGKV